MLKSDGLIRALKLCVLLVAIVGAGSRTSVAQAFSPDMPRNLVVPAVPYEQGMANILAQDAIRPKAMRPILPGRLTDLPTVPGEPGVTPTPPPPEQR